MKKNIFALSILTIFVVGGMYMSKLFIQSKNNIEHNPLSASPTEEEKENRHKYERMMYADPSTGEIPKSIRSLELLYLRDMISESAMNRMASDTLNYTSRGPWNVGGRTRAIAIDVTNENNILAGSVSGGLWRSTNGGTTWNRVGDPNLHPGVVSIAQDTRPGYTNIWYSLSGEIYGTSASADGAFYLGDGVMKSVDNGITWAPVSSTTAGTAASFSSQWQGGWRIRVNPTNGDVLVAVYGTILRSADGGDTWLSELGSLSGGYFTDVAVSHSGVCFAFLSSDGAGKGIYRSIDGQNWTLITPSAFAVNYDRYVIGLDPNNDSIAYFLGVNKDTIGHMSTSFEGDKEYHGFWKYHYLSGDGDSAGGAWTDLAMNLPNSTTFPFDKFYAQGGYDLCVAVQPGNSDVIVIGGTNLFTSTDAFTSLSNVKQIGGYGINSTMPFFWLYPNHHPDQHEVVFYNSNPNQLLSGNDGGVHKTLDCLASTVIWDKLDRGYVTTQFYTIAQDRYNSSDMIIGGLQDNGTFRTTSAAPDANWIMPMNGDGSYCELSSDRHYYLSSQQGKLVKAVVDTAGSIVNAIRIDPIVPFTKSDYLWMNPFKLNYFNDNVMFWLAKNKLMRNKKLDEFIPYSPTPVWDSTSVNWEVVGDSVPSGSTIYTTIEVSRDSHHPNRMYIGTDKRKLYRIDDDLADTVSMTDITGYSIVADGAAFPGSGYIADIAIDPFDADKVIVVFSNYGIASTFYSVDAGDTWRNIGGNTEAVIGTSGSAPSIRCAAICPYDTGYKYFLGTSIGLFSTDSLTAPVVWKQESPDKIGSAVIAALDYRLQDGSLLVATHGNGVFQTFLESTYVSIPEWISSELTIYPNPCQDYIKINNINQDKLSYQIYSLNGKLVANAIYQNSISTKDLLNGMYLIKILSENKTISTQKFIVSH